MKTHSDCLTFPILRNVFLIKDSKIKGKHLIGTPIADYVELVLQEEQLL